MLLCLWSPWETEFSHLNLSESQLTWCTGSSDFTKSCVLLVTFVQLLNFFAVSQKVEDIPFSLCISRHILFCLCYNFSNFSSFYYILKWILTQTYIVMINVYFDEKKCVGIWGHLHLSVLAKQMHIIHAREWFILINTQHITGENILDGDSWSAHINHLSGNVFNWDEILHWWVEDCVWMVDGFIFQQSNLILAVWLSMCFDICPFTHLNKELWWAADWQFSSLTLVWK